MRRLIGFLFTGLFLSCGYTDRGNPSRTERVDHRSGTDTATESPEQAEIDALKKEVLALQGTVNQINAFTSSPFTSCSAALPPFQQTICQIAQTATAENATSFFDSLASVAATLNTQLFGSGCTNTTDPGCPVAGSIASSLAAVVSGQAADAANIATLQANVVAVQNTVTGITNRLNNFNGSGSSIETVVTGINASISTLNAQMASVQSQLSSSSIWKVLQICYDDSASGPLFEAVLESGDKTQVDAYIQSGSLVGLGVLAQAGSSGTQYLATTLNSHVCQFKIYDLTTALKICWDRTNRSQTTSGIDTACDSTHNFASPTSACTCK